MVRAPLWQGLSVRIKPDGRTTEDASSAPPSSRLRRFNHGSGHRPLDCISLSRCSVPSTGVQAIHAPSPFPQLSCPALPPIWLPHFSPPGRRCEGRYGERHVHDAARQEALPLTCLSLLRRPARRQPGTVVHAVIQSVFAK